MTYARDPYDTDEPPCFCPIGSPAPRTTQELCPAHGDPAKPALEPRELCGSCDAGLPMSCTCPPDDDGDGICEHGCDDICELEGCNHSHCFACGECGCAGYCDDYQTYNLRPAETGAEPAPKETHANAPQ